MRSYSHIKNIIHTAVLALLFILPMAYNTTAQTHSSDAYTYCMRPDTLQKYVRVLTSDQAQGREIGTEGAALCANYIASAFERYGLETFDKSYFQKFSASGKKGANIIGKISSTTRSGEYIVIGAHYDHKGIISGKMYRGADDNASGVAALLSLAKAISKYKQDGGKIEKNILFVAFDGKEMSMSGSNYFVNNCRICSRITGMLNIDQIGTSLAAPGKNKEYIIAVGNEKFKEWEGEQLQFCNSANNLKLDIDYTFYGSDTFRQLFYKLSDQYPFAEKNIPAIAFTAGINDHTFKVSDTEAIVEYPLLSKRIKLIYYFIFQLIS